jgi:hypothetical protein
MKKTSRARTVPVVRALSSKVAVMKRPGVADSVVKEDGSMGNRESGTAASVTNTLS